MRYTLFLISMLVLWGCEGKVGPAGPTGSQGPQGPQGVKGDTGATGPAGAQGATGPQGPAGTAGATGPQGPEGPRGSIGPQGIQGVPGPQGEPGSALDWAEVIEDANIEDSIYAIGVRGSGKNYIIGSGFTAFFSNAIWTNGHVVIGVLRALRDFGHLDLTPFAMKSGTAYGGPDTYLLDLNNLYIHPDYDGNTLSPDVGVFFLDAGTFTHEQLLPLLPRILAPYLRVGQPIGTMGFPGEISDPSTTVPIATFKDGTISALRPFHNLSPTPENSRFVQHNLDLSAGTSGSPIFDHRGFVIAVNNAGTDRLVYDQRTGRPERIPSGNIGFGIRVDEIWRVVDDTIIHPEDAAARRTLRASGFSARVIPGREYPSPDYQPFPDNWNGETIAP